MRSAEPRRVVVAGMGAVTPSGLGAGALWESVSAGRSAITVLDGAAFADLPVRIGGQISGFDPTDYLPTQLARRLSPVQHWAVAAADEAMQGAWPSAPGPEPHSADQRRAAAIPGRRAVAIRDGGRPEASDAPAPPELPWDPTRFAIIAATGSGPVDAMQDATRALDSRGPRAVPFTLAVYGAPDGAAAVLSERYGARGPSQAVSATCASGAVGLGEAMRMIRHGYADAVLVVGMEDCLGPVNLAANARMRALAAGYEDRPGEACRPFDRGRTGFVMSQGAAAILLEAESIWRARTPGGNDVIPVELGGFGASSDAHHPTAPDPSGSGAAAAVRQALADATLTPGDVGHINAHGTGTPLGDAAEITALDSVFGPAAGCIPLTATKSTTGHLLGASGVVEAVIATHSLLTGLIPPTANLTDPEFSGHDVVTEQRRIPDLRAVLSTSFGFGGHNGALVLQRRYETND